ncbi:MAG: hypothetical protein ACI83Q_000088 [Colwellia polaris]|jgi:hypothetical protein
MPEDIDFLIESYNVKDEVRRSPERDMDEFFEYTEQRLNTETGKTAF